MTIDWKAQWQDHAPDFDGKVAKIFLPNNAKIELLPGPGFGDRSHPTTRLMLEQLAPLASAQTVFDIGCGSGILSLAALALGSAATYACDIAPEALAHARDNAKRNNLTLHFTAPPPRVDLILMNMIASEQAAAWSAHGRPFKHLLTSGILTQEKEGYREIALKRGWKLQETRSESGWLAFHFTL